MILAILLLLAAPAIDFGFGPIPRERIYPSVTNRFGPFHWIHGQIYEKETPVDIAFMGSSLIWGNINTPYVRKELSSRSGTDGEVITLGWKWAGYDVLLAVASDLLSERKVKTLVIYDEGVDSPEVPHPHSQRIVRWHDDPALFSSLTAGQKTTLYAGSLLGLPRQTLTRFRRDLPDTGSIYHDGVGNTLDLSLTSGAWIDDAAEIQPREGFGIHPLFPEDRSINPISYDAGSADRFSFLEDGDESYQAAFAKRLFELCEARGTRLVMIHLPTAGERLSPEIPVRAPEGWFAKDGPVLLGIPPGELFAGLDAASVDDLYKDGRHMRSAFQSAFTRFITPSLLEAHGQ